jgi:outer membrane protein OmpA-like peptidoglycan-associated protein
VVVVLRDLFKGNELSPAGQERLKELSAVAKAHATFPVVVALHRPSGDVSAEDTARSEAIRKFLTEQGVLRAEVVTLGSAQPVVPRSTRSANQLNDRVELIFVAPTSF